ncbi:MAG TPA: hypothetical protein VLB09_04945, partial [Nitrospiria bacterium]|nr:hypothetical protein [Nitrospiria bacterium]
MGLVAAGCTEHIPEAESPRINHKSPGLIRFEPVPPLSEIRRSILVSEPGYTVEQILFPEFSAKYWKPSGNRRAPAVLLLPAIWGDRTVERFAEALALEGFACLQLSSRRYLERIRSMEPMSLEGLAENIHLQAAEAKQVMDWFSAQKDVDADRLGLLGISFGAIVGGLLTEADERIGSSVLLLGGGNLPEILAAPQGYVKRRLREEIMTENGMTEEEFSAAAAAAMRGVDPLTYAGRLDSRRVFMINGRYDRVIPLKNAREYWEAMGRPQWLV